MSEPIWEAVDNEAAELLSLVADEGHRAAFEWEEWCRCVRHVADRYGRVDPNAMREMVRGVVAPRRVGAFTHRALAFGLLEPCFNADGDYEYVVSTDRKGRNAGKPIRCYRLGDAR